MPSEILKAVASHYGLRVSDMKAKSNAKPVAFPRQVAMYLCRKLTELSYPEIGRLFNDKHHSTVMHSVEKIERMIEDDADFRRVVDGFHPALPLTRAADADLFHRRRFPHPPSRDRAPAIAPVENRRERPQEHHRISSPFLLGFFRCLEILIVPTNTSKCDRLFFLFRGG